MIFDKSKFLMFKFSNEKQSLNVSFINFTFEVLKLDKSNDFNFEHFINILFILVIIRVLKLEIFKLVNSLQP